MTRAGFDLEIPVFSVPHGLNYSAKFPVLYEIYYFHLNRTASFAALVSVSMFSSATTCT
jgi:hypothetical protein